MRSFKKLFVPLHLFKHGWTGILIAGFFLLAYDPMRDVYPQSFDRSIGLGIIRGIDINWVIVHFFLWYFVLFPLILALVYGLLTLARRYVSEQNAPALAVIDASDTLALFAIPLLGIACIQHFNASAEMSLILASIVWLLILCWAYLLFCTKMDMPSLAPDSLLWALGASLSLSYPAFLLCRSLLERNGMVADGGVWVILFLGICLVLILTLHLLRLWSRQRFADLEARLYTSFLPLLFAPAIMSFYVEFRHILASRGYVLHSPYRDILLIYLCAGILSVGLYLWLCGRKKPGLSSWQNLYFPVIILTVFLVGLQIPPVVTLYQSFFEQSNYGVPLSQMLLYGHIPIIESFSAHMLSDLIGRTLFSLLHGDIMAGAIVGYGGYLNIIIALSLYSILSRLWNRYFALGFVLLYPFLWEALVRGFFGTFAMTVPSFGVFPLMLLCVVAMLRVLRRPGWPSYLLYAFSLAFSCLYALDHGLAFSVGTLLTLIFLKITRKSKTAYSLGKILFCLTALALALLGLFVGVCLFKEISVLDRLQEFLSAALSSKSWSFGEIGDSSQTGFSFYYLFVPLTVVAGLLYVFWAELSCKVSLPLIWSAVSLCFGLAYIINLQRAFVRHSYLSLNAWSLMYTAPLFLACVGVLIFKKHKIAIFLSIPLTLMLVSNSALTLQNVSAASVLDWMAYRFTEADYISPVKSEMSRYDLGEWGVPFIGIIDFLNRNLEERETFLDLANQGFLYTATGRESPLYVSQSPSLLNGEYAQEQFIASVEDFDGQIPLALTTTDTIVVGSFLDGIYHSTKYYLLYEYLYQNYRPLGVFEGNFVVWCQNDRYDALSEELGVLGLDPLDTRSLSLTIGPDHYLQELPYLWGNLDTQNAVAGPVLQTLSADDGGQYPVQTDTLPSGGNYLLLELEADAETDAILNLYSAGEEEILTTYHFHVHAGRHKYLFRLSSNYFWHSGVVDNLAVLTETQIHAISVIQENPN